MAPSSLFKKLKAASNRVVTLDDKDIKAVPRSHPTFTLPKNEIPPVTDAEREMWRIARASETHASVSERIQNMKRDGRLYHLHGVWHRRGDEDTSGIKML